VKGTKPTLVVDNAAAVRKVPPAPTWLSAAAKAEWRRVAPLMVERRILTDADLGSLENYCLAQGRVRDIQKMLAGVEPEAWLKLTRAQDKAITMARQLAAELGLTPVSRSRPGIREPEGDDDDEPNPLNVS